MRYAVSVSLVRRLLTVLFLLLLAMGCLGGSEGPLIVSELDCGDPIDVLDAPVEGYLSVLDAVALPDPDVRLQLGSGSDDLGLRGAKLGLMVHAGVSSTITVVDRSQRIGWGNTGNVVAAQRLAIPGCAGPNSESGVWLVYPGGVAVPEPTCMELVIGTSAMTTPTRLAVGTDCPRS